MSVGGIVLDIMSALTVGLALLAPAGVLYRFAKRLSPELNAEAHPFWGSVRGHAYLLGFAVTGFFVAIGASSLIRVMTSGENIVLAQTVAVAPLTVFAVLIAISEIRAKSPDRRIEQANHD